MQYKILSALCALLIATSAVAEGTHDLRGPGAEAFTATITSVQAVGEDSPFIQTSDRRGRVSVREGREAIELNRVLEVTVLEADAGKPTHFITHYSKSIDSRARALFLSSEPTKSEDTSLQGRKRTYKQAKGAWTVSEYGKTQQASRDPYADPRGIYPDTPVAVGHEWEVAPSAIPGPLIEALLPKGRLEGTIQFKFKAIQQTEEGPVAVITYKIDSKYFKESNNRDNSQTYTTQEHIKGAGEITRNLKTHLDTIQFKGHVDTLESTSYNDQGLTFTNQCNMPYSIKSSQKRVALDQRKE